MLSTTLCRRFFCPTPAWLVYSSLAVTGLLFLSERWRWFAFNEHKGWTVLLAVAGVGVVLLLMLLWFLVALVVRWRFQFSIRTLFVMVVAVALPFSWLAMELKRARAETKVAEAMRKLGASVYYDDELVQDVEWLAFTSGALYCVDTGREHVRLAVEPGEPQWLRDCLGDDFFHCLVAVEIQDDERGITGDVIQQVIALPFLKRLGLDYAENLTDADFATLKRQRGLERLFLKGTQITDQGLRELSSLTNLRYLSLAKTKISDEGLASLKGMTRLEMLELSDTSISDEGLKHLRGLDSLQFVYVDGTKVTKKGVKELQVALPNCSVLLCGPGVVG